MATYQLEPELAAVGDARRWLRTQLEGVVDDPDVEYTALLLATELVSNAVLHGRTELQVCFEVEGTCLMIEVHDGNPRLPVVLPESEHATNGRGMFLVQQLAERWGAEPTPDGKRVWAEVDLRVACNA